MTDVPNASTQSPQSPSSSSSQSSWLGLTKCRNMSSSTRLARSVWPSDRGWYAVDILRLTFSKKHTSSQKWELNLGSRSETISEGSPGCRRLNVVCLLRIILNLMVRLSVLIVYLRICCGILWVQVKMTGMKMMMETEETELKHWEHQSFWRRGDEK